jgi:uncharacterized protein (TIGR03790 family)
MKKAMINLIARTLVLGMIGTFLFTAPASAQMPSYDDVLVIMNNNSQLSKDIGEYFQQERNIPQENMCYIDTLTGERATYAEYENIVSQIKAHIQNNNLEETINYLVTTKDIPLMFRTPGEPFTGNYYSLDNFLVTSFASIHSGNPYAAQGYEPYDHANPLFQGMYLVTRLTGYDYEDVKQLVDNATLSFDYDYSGNKNVLLDQGVSAFNLKILDAQEDMEQMGFHVTLGNTTEFVINQQDLIMAFTSGSNDGYSIPGYLWGFDFLPGAIMETAVSSGGRTFDHVKNGGLSIYNGSSVSNYAPQEKAEIPRGFIGALAVNGDHIWCGSGGYNKYYRSGDPYTSGSGIFIFDNNTKQWLSTVYTKENTSNGLVGDYIYDMQSDTGREAIWVATAEGLSKFDTSEQVWIPVLNGYQIRDIEIDGDIMWLATNEGAKKYDIVTGEVTDYPAGTGSIAGNNVTSVAVDPADNSVWFGIMGQGICKFKDDIWSNYTDADSYRNNIRDLALDGDVLWAASRKGLLKIDTATGATSQVYTTVDGLLADDLASLTVDENYVYVGTLVRGVSRFDKNDQWQKIYTSSAYVRELLLDDGDLFGGDNTFRPVVDSGYGPGRSDGDKGICYRALYFCYGTT